MKGLAVGQSLQYLTPPFGTGAISPGGITGGAEIQGAISSGVERHVDIVEVAGSKPASPTTPGTKHLIFLGKIGLPRLFPARKLIRIAFPLQLWQFAVGCNGITP